MVPVWFKKSLSEETLGKAKTALVNHIIKENLRGNLPKPGIEATRAILPEMAKLEPRWSRVIKDGSFSTYYKAHKEFNAVIYNNLSPSAVANLLKKHDEINIPYPGESEEEKEEEVSENEAQLDEEIKQEEKQIKEVEAPLTEEETTPQKEQKVEAKKLQEMSLVTKDQQCKLLLKRWDSSLLPKSKDSMR